MDIPQGYKQTELGIIPDDWEVKRISDFTSIITGGTPSTLRPEYWGGNIMWMSSGELNKKFVFDVEGRITTEGLAQLQISVAYFCNIGLYFLV